MSIRDDVGFRIPIDEYMRTMRKLDPGCPSYRHDTSLIEEAIRQGCALLTLNTSLDICHDRRKSALKTFKHSAYTSSY